VKANEVPAGSVQADYKQNNMAFSAVLAAGSGNATMHVSGAIGIDGVSIGGEAKMDTVSTKVTEFGAGWQWKQSDFVGAIKTKTTQKSDTVDASYFYQKANGTQLGAKFIYDLHKHSSCMCVGTQFQYAADTVVKAKAFSTGSVFAAVEHKLSNPAVKVNVAAEWACPTWNTCVQSKKMGIGLTFGDF
jgi:voltage-dependent anion channel protein 2